MKKLIIIFSAIFAGIILAFSFINSDEKSPQKTSLINEGSVTSTPSDILPVVPARIEIPSLGVNAKVESVAKDSEGRMDIPKNYMNAAWYNLGPKPGEDGNSVVAGHLDTPTGGKSIFYSISQLKNGDEIIVIDENSNKYTYAVFEVANYSDNSFPIEKVFGKTKGKYLNLITCAGVFDKSSQNYSNRTVVYSRLIE